MMIDGASVALNGARDEGEGLPAANANLVHAKPQRPTTGARFLDDEARAGKLVRSMQPTGCLVLLRCVRIKARGGLVIPDLVEDNAAQLAIDGLLVATGPEAWRNPNETDHMRPFPTGPYAQLGQVVMIMKWAGSTFRLGDDVYRMVKDTDVMAVLDDFTVLRPSISSMVS